MDERQKGSECWGFAEEVVSGFFYFVMCVCVWIWHLSCVSILLRLHALCVPVRFLLFFDPCLFLQATISGSQNIFCVQTKNVICELKRNMWCQTRGRFSPWQLFRMFTVRYRFYNLHLLRCSLEINAAQNAKTIFLAFFYYLSSTLEEKRKTFKCCK